MEKQQFNTVISASMKLFNILKESKDQACIYHGFKILLLYFSIFYSYLSYFTVKMLKYGDDILSASWPKVDAKLPP